MKNPMRSFLSVLFIALCSWQTAFGQTAKSLGWKLGVQTWTFHHFTFSEALDKIDSSVVKYVEAYPGQEIGNGMAGKLDYHMDQTKRKKVQKMLRDSGLKMVSYGVVQPKTDQDWTTLFEFAKAMHLRTIVSEPEESQIPLISKLCDQYKIDVAIHDHSRPSHYWGPDIVLAALKGAGPRIGACADVGHWLASGLDPVECLKKLKGHVREIHFRDLNEKGTTDAHDVSWGKGTVDMEGIMQELKRQHFKGFVFAEYDNYHWSSISQLKADLARFNNAAGKLK